ncbi:uncharacterized protein LOC129778500 [Toxorhynchites rutilus septentrionalis]|uniref:uncharacterized protein LOC129778500 n=1 Tax=Toxorhynchites rutilus septentrionalis TaxID=329112 RepID=UPI0024787EFA|nr:uncharacterized protein LOC129778500 [Toxorhynchites rutilus septentrionalis]
MDQYPYSIPPSYQYPESVPDKNAPNVQDGTGISTQNSYYLNPGSTNTGFGFAAVHQQQQQHQQQQMVSQVAPPAVPVPANGLMSQLQSGVPVGYDPYPSQPFHNQVPAPPPIMTTMDSAVSAVSANSMGMNAIYGQQDYTREALVGTGSGGVPMDYPVAPPAVLLPSTEPVSEIAPMPPIHELTSLESSFGANVMTSGTDVPAKVDDVPCVPCAESTEQIGAIPQESDSILPPKEPDRSVPETPSAPVATDSLPNDSTCAQEQIPVVVNSTEQTSDEKPVEPFTEQLASSLHPDHAEEPPQEGVSESPKQSGSETATHRAPNAPIDDTGGQTTKKKRRRIVQLNDDDSDDEDDCDRMELLRSPEPAAVVDDVGAVPTHPPESHDVKDKLDEAGDGGSCSENENERRPNSSCSGNNASSIFQNVVMIPAGESEAHKRKKIRVLDSDDDEEEQRVADSVDDIGLTGDGDELNAGGLLMDENAEDGDYGAMEGIEMDKMEQIVTMDAPIFDPTNMPNDDEDDSESDADNKSKSESDQEHHSDNEGEPDEELGEEEEIVEDGVEMIAAENEEGEAIGIATDDEEELEEDNEQQQSGSEGEESDRGSDREQHASDKSDASDNEQESESEREKENDQNDSRSTASPVEQEKESQKPVSDQQKENDTAKAGSEDDVVCQNDLELNTISLLTDEEDNCTATLPPPKKELPVVRIVNIKKELLDDRNYKRDSITATSYQQQHYLKQQQLAQRRQEKKKKRKKERSFDNDDPFGAWSTSSSEEEFIPNDIYFGTPDRVFTVSTKIRCQRQKIMNERYSKHGRSAKSGKRRYSDESDAEERRKRKQKLEQVARLNLPSYQQQQLQNLIKRKKKRKHDRFYDKSQDIPNDIYFGNVNVPLHILYAFGSSSSDDELFDRNRANTSWRPSQSSAGKTGRYHSSSRPTKSTSSSSYRSSVSPSNDRSVQAMKEYLKIAGFKNVKFHKLWEGCKSNQERANAILRLMQEKGLEGEPTIAKCRELRKQLQMEREAKVLDTSLIIDSGEGRTTRRSVKHTPNCGSEDPSDPYAPSTSGTSQAPVVPPESLETLNRIRNVIDPDSDGE